MKEVFGFEFLNLRQKAEKYVLKVIPFSSVRKKMTTLLKLNSYLIRIYIKGATEVLL